MRMSISVRKGRAARSIRVSTPTFSARPGAFRSESITRVQVLLPLRARTEPSAPKSVSISSVFVGTRSLVGNNAKRFRASGDMLECRFEFSVSDFEHIKA